MVAPAGKVYRLPPVSKALGTQEEAEPIPRHSRPSERDDGVNKDPEGVLGSPMGCCQEGFFEEGSLEAGAE